MTVKKTAANKEAAKNEDVKGAAKKPATKRTCTKKCADSEYINAESAGFRAGDVYQALAAAGKSLKVAEIAKAANITENQVLLGLGWLFKEGKVKGENVADICLA